jgi:uncharacterized membrane protein YphA (DoxX/SURF4 family)
MSGLTVRLAFDGIELQARLQQFALALRVIIGWTFCISGLLKIVNRDLFVEALETYGLFSANLIEAASLIVPHVEMVLGLLLSFGIRTAMLSWIFAAQLIVFSGLGAIATLRGNAVDCGCFPVSGAKDVIGIDFFIRNGALFILCLWVGSRFRRSNP